MQNLSDFIGELRKILQEIKENIEKNAYPNLRLSSLQKIKILENKIGQLNGASISQSYLAQIFEIIKWQQTFSNDPKNLSAPGYVFGRSKINDQDKFLKYLDKVPQMIDETKEVFDITESNMCLGGIAAFSKNWKTLQVKLTIRWVDSKKQCYTRDLTSILIFKDFILNTNEHVHHITHKKFAKHVPEFLPQVKQLSPLQPWASFLITKDKFIVSLSQNFQYAVPTEKQTKLQLCSGMMLNVCPEYSINIDHVAPNIVPDQQIFIPIQQEEVQVAPQLTLKTLTNSCYKLTTHFKTAQLKKFRTTAEFHNQNDIRIRENTSDQQDLHKVKVQLDKTPYEFSIKNRSIEKQLKGEFNSFFPSIEWPIGIETMNAKPSFGIVLENRVQIDFEFLNKWTN